MKSFLRVALSALFVFVSISARAQSITDAVNTAGASWFGYVTEQISIFGSSFIGVTEVKFNGVVTGFSITADNQLYANVPVGATTGLISLKKGAAAAVFSSTVFQVVAPGPFVTGFSPVGGPAGTVVTINGVRFNSVPGTNGVFFNGKKATATVITTSTQIQATVPPGVITGPITVGSAIAPQGTNTTSTNFFGPPVITSFNPASGRTGTNVVITGTNLLGTTSLLFNGLPAIITQTNNNQLTAVVPVNAITGPLTLTAPGGGFPTSSNFVVLPTITNFSPSFGVIGTSVTISGANFNVGTPVVRFNGVASASVTGVSFGQLTATVPAGAATGPITVTTTAGTATSAGLFYLPPVINSFTPTNSAPGTTVTLTGVNFTGATAVRFNGTTASFSGVTSNSLLATVPAGFTTGPLTVVTPGGSNTTTALFYAAPTISSFSPTHGLPGTNVLVAGNNFLGATVISFNGLAGTTLVVLNNSNATINVPLGASTGPVAVTAPAGIATSVTDFVLDYASDLAVTVTNTPNPVTVFNSLSYAVAVKNRGPHPAPAVTLSNTLPAGALLQSTPVVSQGTLTTNGSLVIASFGALASNDTATLSYIVTPQTSGVTLTNLARAFSGYTDPILTNNVVTNYTYVEPQALLSVALDASNAVQLSWSSALSNYALQFNPNLATNTWSNVATPPVTGGGSNVVTQTNLAPLMYFRLRR